MARYLFWALGVRGQGMTERRTQSGAVFTCG